MIDDERLRRLVAIARDLILIPTTSSRPAEIARGLAYVENHVDVGGVEITRFERNGKPSLVARPRSVERPKVFLIGHIDTVEIPDCDYRPRVVNGRVVGPGAADMKGALAVLLETFRTFHVAHPGLSLGLVVTSDEESGGYDGTGYLFGEVGLWCDVALIPDSGDIDAVTVEEKGILHLRLVAKGPSGHGARPWTAPNPAERIAEAVGRIRARFATFAKDDGGAHWHPTCAVTGLTTPLPSPNRIPDRAEALLDIRFTPDHTLEEMHALVAAEAGEEVEVEVLVTAPPTRCEPDASYLEAIESVLGRPPRRVRAHGGSDARFLTARGIPVILHRPRGGEVHTAREWVEVESLSALMRIYERYLLDFLP